MRCRTLHPLAENIDVDIEVMIDDLDLDHVAAIADGSAELDDVTLLSPSMRKPRWTPPMPNEVAVQREGGSVIAPRSVNDSDSGEIRARRG